MKYHAILTGVSDILVDFNFVFLLYKMRNKKLHIICFDNPYPPVYGGVIDVFYKIKALHQLGVEINLHCFVNEIPEEISELRSITEKCHFYKRNKSMFNILSSKPFSVASRSHKGLFKNLNQDKSDILFEGLQSTSVLCVKNFKDRNLYLRLHNLENNYYKGLLNSETNYFKKALYLIESYKYDNYLKVLGEFCRVFTLSSFETNAVNKLYNNAEYIPVFHGNKCVAETSEFGEYAFYNGDLRISDNKRAAEFLIDVFQKVQNYPLIIASSIENHELVKRCEHLKNVQYLVIKDQEHLENLSQNAHINVMMSFQESGTKLKAINALFKSRHCVINKNMLDDVRLQDLCELVESKKDFVDAIENLQLKPFKGHQKRELVLKEVLNDMSNAEKLYGLIG